MKKYSHLSFVISKIYYSLYYFMTKVKIEVLNNVSKNNANYIYNIYKKDLSGDVFPNFGKKFLIKFISFVTKDNEGVIIISRNKSKIIGFLILRFKPIDSKKLINLISINSLIIFFFNSLLKPLIFFRLIFQIFRKDSVPKSCSEIYPFVVNNKYQSMGIGSKLINKAELLSYQKGLKKILTKTRNERLFKYYKSVKKITLISKYKILRDTYHKFYWNVK